MPSFCCTYMNWKVVGNIGFFNYHHHHRHPLPKPRAGAVLATAVHRLVVMQAAHPLLALLVMASPLSSFVSTSTRLASVSQPAPLTRTLAQFSFRHAPVLKGIFFASAAATFACYSSKYAADFVEVCTRHLPIRQPRLRAPHAPAAR